MELIIEGDTSKMQENFTRAMFNIVLEDFKNGTLVEIKEDKPIVNSTEQSKKTA